MSLISVGEVIYFMLSMNQSTPVNYGDLKAEDASFKGLMLLISMIISEAKVEISGKIHGT
jgi:hypothetical protein